MRFMFYMTSTLAVSELYYLAGMLESLEQFRDEPLLKIAHDICRWHHERYDGRELS